MKNGHPSVIGTGPKIRPDTPPESAQEEARNRADRPALAAQDAQDAQGGLQREVEGEETALAEPEDTQDGPAATLTHLRGVVVGSRDRRVTYAPHLVLSGAKLDGRTSYARIEKRRRDQIARDRGYSEFADAPGVLQNEIAGYVRLSIICDLVWAGFLSGGRLMLEAFRDFEQVKTRKAIHLGLERVLKDAKTVDLQTYVRQRYGGNGEGPAAPADSADPPSSPDERASEAVRATQEAEKP